MSILYDRLIRFDVGDCFTLRDWTDSLWYVVGKLEDGTITLTPAADQPEPPAPAPTGPTEEQIAEFNKLAAEMAACYGISLEDAKQDLGTLLQALIDDPVGTRLYFAELRIAQLEEIVRASAGAWASIAAAAARMSVSSKIPSCA
jgi:hypothetical protein